MLTFIRFMMHFLIVGGLLGLTWYTGRVILATPAQDERKIRFMSLLGGFLVYLGSRALGVSIPQLIFDSLNVAGPISVTGVLLILAQAVFPAFSGAFVGYFLLRAYKDPNQRDFGFRVLIMVSALIISLFGDVYAASLGHESEGPLNPLLLPNLCFLVGLILYIMKMYGAVVQPAPGRSKWKSLV